TGPIRASRTERCRTTRCCSTFLPYGLRRRQRVSAFWWTIRSASTALQNRRDLSFRLARPFRSDHQRSGSRQRSSRLARPLPRLCAPAAYLRTTGALRTVAEVESSALALPSENAVHFLAWPERTCHEPSA